MDSIFIDGIKHKDGIKRIPYFGIYQKGFFNRYYVPLSVDGQYNDTNQVLAIVQYKYAQYEFKQLTPEGEIDYYYGNIFKQNFEQLKEICPPMEYRREGLMLYYSFPQFVTQSFTKTHPTSAQYNWLRANFQNTETSYPCLLSLRNNRYVDNTSPRPAEQPYLQEFFGGYWGIRIYSYFNFDNVSDKVTITFSYNYIPW